MTRLILGIDPGTTESGICLIEVGEFNQVNIQRAEKVPNLEVRRFIQAWRHKGWQIACEGMVYQGQGFGAESIKTCYEIGRLMQLCSQLGLGFTIYSRREYGRFFVPEGTLNDATLRASLEQIFGPSSKKLDPLFLLRGASDKRSAFAVAKYHQHRITSPGYVPPADLIDESQDLQNSEG